MENSKETAFPMVVDATKHTEWHSGLTKREYFAAVAMQGLLSNPNIKRPMRSDLPKEHEDFADTCIQYADELLKQLEK